MIRIVKGWYGHRVGNIIRPVPHGATLTLDAGEEDCLVRIGVAVRVDAPEDNRKAIAPKATAAKPRPSRKKTEAK